MPLITISSFLNDIKDALIARNSIVETYEDVSTKLTVKIKECDMIVQFTSTGYIYLGSWSGTEFTILDNPKNTGTTGNIISSPTAFAIVTAISWTTAHLEVVVFTEVGSRKLVIGLTTADATGGSAASRVTSLDTTASVASGALETLVPLIPHDFTSIKSADNFVYQSSFGMANIVRGTLAAESTPGIKMLAKAYDTTSHVTIHGKHVAVPVRYTNTYASSPYKALTRTEHKTWLLFENVFA